MDPLDSAGDLPASTSAPVPSTSRQPPPPPPAFYHQYQMASPLEQSHQYFHPHHYPSGALLYSSEVAGYAPAPTSALYCPVGPSTAYYSSSSAAVAPAILLEQGGNNNHPSPSSAFQMAKELTPDSSSSSEEMVEQEQADDSNAAVPSTPPPPPNSISYALQHQHQHLHRSPFETFCTVPGRTSLLSATTKYKVTVGEVQRRISPPECLNASLLGGILRKAKSKDGGKALRESLKRIGLSLPAGRRKSTNVTAWTALVEEEAVHMARDFNALCERDFPSREMAVFLGRHTLNSEEEAQRRRTMLFYARLFIKELADLFNADRSPLCASRPEIILDSTIQKPLTHFSMVSHGFGGLAVTSLLASLSNYVHESLRYLDTRQQSAPSAEFAVQQQI